MDYKCEIIFYSTQLNKNLKILLLSTLRLNVNVTSICMIIEFKKKTIIYYFRAMTLTPLQPLTVSIAYYGSMGHELSL